MKIIIILCIGMVLIFTGCDLFEQLESAMLKWDASLNATEYNAYKGCDAIPDLFDTTTETQIELTQQEVIQCYRVTAKNSAGESDYSEPVTNIRGDVYAFHNSVMIN